MEIKPKKSLGQNFLKDSNIIKQIVDVGNISENNTVIEVGPGTGNLTEKILSRKPKKIITVEKDKFLAKKLYEDKNFLNQVLSSGAIRARQISQNTISDVYKIAGMI